MKRVLIGVSHDFKGVLTYVLCCISSVFFGENLFVKIYNIPKRLQSYGFFLNYAIVFYKNMKIV